MFDPTLWSRRRVLHLGSQLGSSLLGFNLGSRSALAPSPSNAFTFVTNWYAQAEHGGFYQALATGLYNRYGLDVTIKMGGVSVNIIQLVVAGGADFAMGGSATALQAVAAGIPLVAIAAFFQEDPQCILAHPHQGLESLADLKGHPIFISLGAELTYWPFLRARLGFQDDQKRPYTYSLGPFLLDPASGQQGYLTSEVYRVRAEADFDPVVFPLADYGFNPYATMLLTTQRLIDTQPERVQQFVNASIEGWTSYLEDPSPAHRLIKQANPRMTDDYLAFSYNTMKKYRILHSPATATGGLGSMTDERWQDFFNLLVELKILKSNLPYHQAFTTQFVNQGVGLTPGSTALNVSSIHVSSIHVSSIQ